MDNTNTLENGRTTRCMGQANLHMPAAMYMMAHGVMGCTKVQAPTYGLMEGAMR